MFNEYADTRKGHPSGLKLEDMLLYLRQKIFVMFRGSKNKKGGTKTVTEDEMPDKYFPTGYFAFVAFGPMPMSGLSLSVFTADGTNVKKVGRAQVRKDEAKRKEAERDQGIAGFVVSE